MATGFSFEELCRTPLKSFLKTRETEEDKFAWYRDFIKLPGGGEAIGIHEVGMSRYNALRPFQQLVFDRMEYKFQMVIKRGTDQEWLDFVKESLNG